jgi:hypothetical protein
MSLALGIAIGIGAAIALVFVALVVAGRAFDRLFGSR